MTKAEAARRYGRYRQALYLSIVERKSDLDYLKRSTLLSKREKELLQNTIDSLEELRIEFAANRGKAIITATQKQLEEDI
jgi:hypothetical protein